MADQHQAEFGDIGNLVKMAGIPEEHKRTALWCLAKLPTLCEAFCRTYESRYAEEILHLEQGMLTRLAPPNPLTEAVTLSLRTLNERIGLPSFEPAKPRKPSPSRRRKTAC